MCGEHSFREAERHGSQASAQGEHAQEEDHLREALLSRWYQNEETRQAKESRRIQFVHRTDSLCLLLQLLCVCSALRRAEKRPPFAARRSFKQLLCSVLVLVLQEGQ